MYDWEDGGRLKLHRLDILALVANSLKNDVHTAYQLYPEFINVELLIQLDMEWPKQRILFVMQTFFKTPCTQIHV